MNVKMPEVLDNVNKNNTPSSKIINADEIVFANESEKEFARILDFYKIKWQYEPKTFPLEFDDEGIAVLSFSPDFYLPDLDLFIELTTLNQNLVTKKNKKIRKLRELYPYINIKLFYKKDYDSLLFKFVK
ncbi:MAG: PDDEXK family nuclease [Candidatus Humimicrobiaceae bacterium]